MSSKEEISFGITDEEIVFAALTDRAQLEAIVICKSGQVILFDCEKGSSVALRQSSFNPYQLNLQIHSFRDFVCISQKNGTFGMVVDLAEPDYIKELERGDYCAYAWQFPIAFYSRTTRRI